MYICIYIYTPAPSNFVPTKPLKNADLTRNHLGTQTGKLHIYTLLLFKAHHYDVFFLKTLCFFSFATYYNAQQQNGCVVEVSTLVEKGHSAWKFTRGHGTELTTVVKYTCIKKKYKGITVVSDFCKY